MRACVSEEPYLICPLAQLLVQVTSRHQLLDLMDELALFGLLVDAYSLRSSPRHPSCCFVGSNALAHVRLNPVLPHRFRYRLMGWAGTSGRPLMEHRKPWPQSTTR